MATLKQRLLKKNSSGSYDTVHLETSATNVLMSNGTTVEAAINGKAAANHTHTAAQVGAAATNHTHSGYAASSHNHAAANITSGILPVARGGTGVTSYQALGQNIADISYDGDYMGTGAVILNMSSETPVTVNVESHLSQHPELPWFYISCANIALHVGNTDVTFYCTAVTENASVINVRQYQSMEYDIRLVGTDMLTKSCFAVIQATLVKGKTLTLSAKKANIKGKIAGSSSTYTYSGRDTEYVTVRYNFKMYR